MTKIKQPTGRPILQIEGFHFGRLIAISRLGTIDRNSLWLCLCNCGNFIKRSAISLKNGSSWHCGCDFSARRKHGHTSCGKWSNEYTSWVGMMGRCNDPKNNRYYRYGARGIRVCERWMDFRNFISDMGSKPTPKHSIDRVDNDGNYCPENCRWADSFQQWENRRK